MKMIYNAKTAERLREQYPAGTRIRLESMDDPYSAVPSGTCGTVKYVDDACNIHMSWDNGSMLALVPDVDRFAVIMRELTPLKLYMPLHCDLYSRNEYGDLEEYPEHIDRREALEYADSILAAIVKYRMPEEATRGLMHWYREPDSVNKKVHRAEFSVEQRRGALWGTVECMTDGELTGDEMSVFKEYITGQASDGWGEGLEQQDIKVGGCVLNVHLWSSEHDWQLMTEKEFVQNCEQTPQMDSMSY